MLLFLWLFVISAPVLAQECLSSDHCRSRLIDLRIQTNAVSSAFSDEKTLEKFGAPAVQAYFESDIFKQQFITNYSIAQPIAFPHNKNSCLREKKQGDPKFQNINCF